MFSEFIVTDEKPSKTMTFKEYLADITQRKIEAVHNYQIDHPGCTVREMVTFIPETERFILTHMRRG